ncbi:MAG: serine/threonine-protein phosphatase, partial [Alphaproteobacteria bacterium]
WAGGEARPVPPARVLQRANDRLLDELHTDLYATAAVAVCEPGSGRVTYASAGHPDALVLEPGGEMRWIDGSGVPLGMLRGVEWEEQRIELAPGARLLIHSDGFTECPDAAGRLLGPEGLAAIAARERTASADDLADALLAAMRARSGGARAPDDLSCIVLERAEEAPRRRPPRAPP